MKNLPKVKEYEGIEVLLLRQSFATLALEGFVFILFENFMLNILDSFSIAQWVAVFVGLSSLFIILFYYVFIFGKLAFAKKQEQHYNYTEPVSIVICARNEHENLKTNLPLILEQDYPEFQVVVVNDRSWDDTEPLLESLEKKYSHLKVVTILDQDKYETGKKFALTLGIKATVHENLLFTDADCFPASTQWIKLMCGNFQNKKTIVLGFGGHKKEDGFLNKLIRFDTFHSALQYFSFALNGNPYMGVGRNLAYKKSVFFANKGFASHQHIVSGDDDLFINETANKSNTVTELNPESFTVSAAKKSFADWTTQKVRHLSTSKFYKGNHRFALGLYWAVQIVFYISLPAMLVVFTPWQIPVILLVLKFIIQYIYFGFAMKKLNETDLILLLPFLDLIMILVYPTFAIRGYFTKTTKWK